MDKEHDLLNQAITDFQNGNLNRAEVALKRAIQSNPQNAAALHILGLVYASSGNLPSAIEYLKKAASLDPSDGAIYFNLAKAMIESNSYHEAFPFLKKCVQLSPNNPHAWLLYGKAYFSIGNYAESLTQFDRALHVNNNFAEAFTNKSHVLFEIGRYDEALHCAERALSLNPQIFQTWSLIGLILKKLGQTEKASEAFHQATKLKPDHTQSHANYSSTLYELGLYEEALVSAKRALELNHQIPEIWLLTGIALKKLERHDEAIAAFENALKLRQDFPEAYLNMGSTLAELKKFDRAIVNFNKAIDLRPNYAEAYCDKASSLYEQGHFEEALNQCTIAIEQKPNYAPSYFTKACVLSAQKKHVEAIENYEVAIRLKPDLNDAYWNESLSLLLLGDYQKGWDRYEYRWLRNGADRCLYPHIPKLESIDSVQNQKVVVWHEQGFGDVIQFSRYVPLLYERGASLTFLVQKPLLELFQEQLDCRVTSDYLIDEKFDFAIPLLSLPKLFQTTLDCIPQVKPFQISQNKVNDWKKRLSLSQTKLNVGLAISGSRSFKLFTENMVPIEKMKPLLSYCQFFLIQKELTPEEEVFAQQYPEISFLGTQIKNFHDTAAIIQSLDIVISSDTSIIHMAGSLNKQSFLLSRWNPDWRWLIDRTDSPWYPTVHILRQPTKGDWDSVIEVLQSKIAQLAQSK